jgi:hypothetical protein
MSKPPKMRGDYQVGYGRPPVHTRFKPGRSGDPAGGRKPRLTPPEVLMKEAARLVKVRTGDTVETITKHEAIVRRLLQMAMEGEIAAARLVLLGLSHNAPSPGEGLVADETDNLSLAVTPDDDTLRRMLARFPHLQSKEPEIDK